jgi:acyl-CoA thioester hydrolase
MPFHELSPEKTTSHAELRVRFCDTDLMGIVHHANYLAYFEAGRVDWLRRRGVTYRDWAARGIHLPVVDASVRYHKPARFDDVIVVATTLGELRAASLRFDYRITRDGTLLCEGSTRLGCIDDAHRVRRFDPETLDVLRAGERVDAADDAERHGPPAG